MLLYSTLTEISENIVPNSYKFVPHGRMLHFSHCHTICWSTLLIHTDIILSGSGIFLLSPIHAFL